MYQIETGESHTFEFAVDGEKYAIPTFDGLPYKLLKEYREYSKGDVNGADIAMWAIDNIFEAYAPGCTDKLTIGQMYGLIDAYTTREAVGE